MLYIDFSTSDLLLVNGFQNLAPTFYGWLGKALALTKLDKSFGLLELLFVLFQRLVDVFAVF